MRHPLATAGFDVREAATGRDALRLGRLQMDAIVLDLALPDMTGYDVLRKLKDDPATHNIPVIMKTAVYLDGTGRSRWPQALRSISRSRSTRRRWSPPCAESLTRHRSPDEQRLANRYAALRAAAAPGGLLLLGPLGPR